MQRGYQIPPPLRWGLVVDGDVHAGPPCQSNTMPTPSASTTHFPPRGKDTEANNSGRRSAAGPQKTCKRCATFPLALDTWESTAVQLYRDIKRHHAEQRHMTSPHTAKSDLHRPTSRRCVSTPEAAQNDIPSTFPDEMLLFSAFPQAESLPSSKAVAKKGIVVPFYRPLLLQFFVQTHFLPGDDAQRTVWWCRSRPSLAPSVLPDIIYRIISVGRHTVASAARWLLDVYLRLVTDVAVVEDFAKDSSNQSHHCSTCSYKTFQTQWLWASSVATAAQQLQECKPVPFCLSSASHDIKASASGDEDWSYFIFILLEKVVKMLFDCCIAPEAATKQNEVSALACLATLFHCSVTTSCFEKAAVAPGQPVDGTSALIPLSSHTEASLTIGNTPEVMLHRRQLHWIAFTRDTIQQLHVIPPLYLYILPILDAVLATQ